MHFVYDCVEINTPDKHNTDTRGASCSPRGPWPRWGPSGQTRLAGSGSGTAVGTTPAASALQRSETHVGRQETDGQAGENETDERESGESDRQTDRKTETPVEIQIERKTDIQERERERERETGRQTHKETDSQSIRPRDRPVNQNP